MSRKKPIKRNALGNALGYETESICDENGTYYPPVMEGKGRPARYSQRYCVGDRIVRAFATCHTTARVKNAITDRHCRPISKQHIQYWKQLALDKGLIVQIEREGIRNRHFYVRGPNYHLLDMFPGKWQYKDSKPIICRVHCAAGNAIRVDVKKSVYEDISIIDQAGIIHTLKIEPKRKRNHLEATFSLLIPYKIIGYQGAYATIHYVSSDYGDCIYISPPEVRLAKDQLTGNIPSVSTDLELMGLEWFYDGHENDPFCGAVAYVLDVLEKRSWKFDGWVDFREFHYAFDEKTVKNYYPALFEGVPQLKGPLDAEQTGLWIDRSHNQRELETDDPGVANEIAALLEFSRLRISGERSYCNGYKK